MRRKDHLKIHIDEHKITPLYRQLADGILLAIKEGEIINNDVLPSIHDLHVELDISRGTVEKAYKLLIRKGVVGSVQGKGFYIVSQELAFQLEDIR